MCKPRKTYCFTGLSSSKNYRVYNNSLSAIERAILERVFYVKVDGKFQAPHRPSTESFEAAVGSFTDALRKRAQYTVPMEPMQFALSYQDRRRAIYTKAANENALLGFDPKTAQCGSFVKCEKYLFTAEKEPVPRIIQPRDPRYIIETGRYIKPIEKKVYNAINDIYGDIVVYKGQNALERAKNLHNTWSRYDKPVACGIDAHRFDQHVSNPALTWENKVYTPYYPGDKHFARLMKLQRNNVCKARCADGNVSYHTKHNRMSGDSNTSLGNVVIMCGILFGYREKFDIKFSLINDGDDCVLIMEQSELHKLQTMDSHFHSAGFTITKEDPVYEFEQIEFCQCRPVALDVGEYIMVRDPRKAIAKDCVAIKPLDNQSVRNQWCAAVGKGGISLTKGLPVLPQFYGVFNRASNGAKKLKDPTLTGGLFRLSRGMELKDKIVSDYSRYSFWLAFGVTPQEQLALEDYYNKYVMEVGDVNNRFTNLPI